MFKKYFKNQLYFIPILNNTHKMLHASTVLSFKMSNNNISLHLKNNSEESFLILS